MHPWLTLLAALNGLQLAAATPYSCPKNLTIFPQLPSGTFSFPAAGADTHYQSPQRCLQRVPINDGYYAVFDFASNLGTSDRLTVTFEHNNLMTMDLEKKQVRTAAKSLLIWLEAAANSTGSLNYTVAWKPMVPPMSPITYTLFDYSYAALTTLGLNYTNVFTVTMLNSTAIASISASCPINAELFLSSEITVQNGTTVDTKKSRSPYYTLYDVVTYSSPYGFEPPEKQLANRSLTLYNPMPIVENTNCGFLVYDKRNVEQFSKVSYEYVTSVGNAGSFFANATAPKPTAMFINTANGQAATISVLGSYTNADFLIVVYAEMPKPGAFNMPIAILTKDTPLPYKFTARFVTLVMSGGSVYYYFTQ